jgi:hypothetical protein
MTNSKEIKLKDKYYQELSKLLEPFIGTLNDEYTRIHIKYVINEYINSIYPTDYVVDCVISNELNNITIIPVETNRLKTDVPNDFLQ